MDDYVVTQRAMPGFEHIAGMTSKTKMQLAGA